MHKAECQQAICSMLITGATGAIGQALVAHYAVPGRHLYLQGRNLKLLEQLRQKAEQSGATVTLVALDLTDQAALQLWFGKLQHQQFDLVILNHGMNINHGPDNGGESWADAEQLLQLNLVATMAIVHAVLPQMRQRRSGQIALLSSLAAWYGLPVTPSYSASKAALKAYGEGMRGWLAPQGVKMNVILPGYVDSDMSRAMPGPKPFLWTPERAARHIAKRLATNQGRISFPFPLNLGCWLLAVTHPAISERILTWLNYRG